MVNEESLLIIHFHEWNNRGAESGVNEKEWREKESRIQFHHDERKDEEFVCFLYDELI